MSLAPARGPTYAPMRLCAYAPGGARITVEVGKMARLIYSAIASLDGYIEDEQGKFEWAEPDQDVHAFVNETERPVGTYLYGRRMYETMVYWETVPTGPEQTAPSREF